MKKLYLIRHAKSSWKDMALDDFDRPLNKRGKKNAPFMAKILKEKNILPDALISSPANRAKSTAKAFKVHLLPNKSIIYLESLYHPSVYELENVINNIDDKYDTVFLFSHNPALNEFVEEHLGFEDNIPTCGIVGIDFHCNKWEESIKSKKELTLFDYPKNYETNEDEI